MIDALNIIGVKQIQQNDRRFDVVYYQDANSPFMTFFEVLSDGRRVPFKVSDAFYNFIRFEVSHEDESDASMMKMESPLKILENEAIRLIKENY